MPATLPTVLTSFVGRSQEMVDIPQLIVQSRLVTLTGTAGCGKTRLAVHIGEDIQIQFADGVYWVDLTRLSDAALLPQTIAKVLHISEGASWIDNLVDTLAAAQLLLVLDNCEHVLAACAELAEILLTTTEVSILATSRQPLGIAGEAVYSVPPLNQSEALRLFEERAKAILPPFELTVLNSDAAANICQRLDGIPLAIELACARVNVLTVEQIAARLDRAFALLASASHTTYSHHDTLHSAIAWSHDLLNEQEQMMLRRLSVFAGGCSLTQAEAVCEGEGIHPEDVLDLLSSLVNKSLVQADTVRRGEARYTLLETIRQFAREKLIAADEQETLKDRHLQHFLHVTEETESKTRSPYQQLWLNWLEAEFDNIRAALTWSLEGGNVEAGLGIAIALYQLWTIRDYVEEGFAWYERLLSAPDGKISTLARACALCYATTTAGFRGNTAAQIAYGEQAGLLAEELGDSNKASLAWALTAQAYGLRGTGDHEAEFRLTAQVIELWRELDEPYQLALALTIYSFTAMSLEKYDVARAWLDEGLPLVRQIGVPYRIAMALNFSGDLARCQKDYVLAQANYEESLSLLREIDAVRDLASVLHNLGHTYLHLGDVARAADLFNQSMTLHEEQQNLPGIGECLIGFAAVAAVNGLPGAGARLIAAAVSLGGERIATAWAATRMEYDHYLARIREDLSETHFKIEQMKGQALSLEQALEAARVAAGKSAQPTDALTAREREVVGLIARAHSNDEIADALVLSKRTVEKHIANIRSKLGFTKRAEIIRWAIEAGLVEG